MKLGMGVRLKLSTDTSNQLAALLRTRLVQTCSTRSMVCGLRLTISNEVNYGDVSIW